MSNTLLPIIQASSLKENPISSWRELRGFTRVVGEDFTRQLVRESANDACICDMDGSATSTLQHFASAGFLSDDASEWITNGNSANLLFDIEPVLDFQDEITSWDNLKALLTSKKSELEEELSKSQEVKLSYRQVFDAMCEGELLKPFKGGLVPWGRNIYYLDLSEAINDFVAGKIEDYSSDGKKFTDWSEMKRFMLENESEIQNSYFNFMEERGGVLPEHEGRKIAYVTTALALIEGGWVKENPVGVKNKAMALDRGNRIKEVVRSFASEVVAGSAKFENWEDLKPLLIQNKTKMDEENFRQARVSYLPGFNEGETVHFESYCFALKEMGYIDAPDQSWSRNASCLDLGVRLAPVMAEKKPMLFAASEKFKTWEETIEFLRANKKELENRNFLTLNPSIKKVEARHNSRLSYVSLYCALREMGWLGYDRDHRQIGSMDLFERIENFYSLSPLPVDATWDDYREWYLKNHDELVKENKRNGGVGEYLASFTVIRSLETAGLLTGSAVSEAGNRGFLLSYAMSEEDRMRNVLIPALLKLDPASYPNDDESLVLAIRENIYAKALPTATSITDLKKIQALRKVMGGKTPETAAEKCGMTIASARKYWEFAKNPGLYEAKTYGDSGRGVSTKLKNLIEESLHLEYAQKILSLWRERRLPQVDVLV